MWTIPKSNPYYHFHHILLICIGRKTVKLFYSLEFWLLTNWFLHILHFSYCRRAERLLSTSCIAMHCWKIILGQFRFQNLKNNINLSPEAMWIVMHNWICIRFFVWRQSTLHLYFSFLSVIQEGRITTHKMKPSIFIKKSASNRIFIR